MIFRRRTKARAFPQIRNFINWTLIVHPCQTAPNPTLTRTSNSERKRICPWKEKENLSELCDCAECLLRLLRWWRFINIIYWGIEPSHHLHSLITVGISLFMPGTTKKSCYERMQKQSKVHKNAISSHGICRTHVKVFQRIKIAWHCMTLYVHPNSHCISFLST